MSVVSIDYRVNISKEDFWSKINFLEQVEFPYSYIQPPFQLARCFLPWILSRADYVYLFTCLFMLKNFPALGSQSAWYGANTALQYISTLRCEVCFVIS